MSVEISLVRPRRRLTRARYLLVRLAMLAAAVIAVLFLLPSFLGLSRVVVTDPGMAHAFRPGSLVLAERVPAQRLRVGDVITYTPPGHTGVIGPVTHRIVEISDGSARTAADSAVAVDPWQVDLTSGTQLRAVTSLPWVGYVFLALADQATRLVFIALPAVCVALLSLADYFTRAPRRAPVKVPTPRQPGPPSGIDRPFPTGRTRRDISAALRLPEYPAARVSDTPGMSG